MIEKEYELDYARNIFGKRVNYKKNAINIVPDQATFELPECTVFVKTSDKHFPKRDLPMDDWITFFGIWIAEGWADKYSVGFAAHKPRVKEALTACATKFGFTFNKLSDGITDGNNRWEIRDRQFAHYLHPLSVGSTNKKLADWCFRLSQRQSELLVEALMLGDGHKCKGGGCYQYYTSSTRLADDVSTLALHAGWSGNIHQRFEVGHSVWLERDQRNITTTTPGYVVTIVRKKNEPQVNHGHVKSQNGQRESWIDFKGRVYCCTVSSGVFYVRKNGKSVWTGNSRFAQKGTLGLVLNDDEMPVSMKDGTSPDIIINPHSIPSRMTIGKIIEIVASKVAALSGESANATAFRPYTVDDLRRSLKQYGYDEFGNEPMISGITGKPMQAQIFTGPCYYQMLRHHVQDKMQRRDTGAVVPRHRQPVGGRGTEGGSGLRVGEMEHWAFVSHGASSVLRERLCLVSDKYTTVFCEVCGTIAIADHVDKGYVCRRCGTQGSFGVGTIPYAYKLLVHLLAGAGLSMRVRLSQGPA